MDKDVREEEIFFLSLITYIHRRDPEKRLTHPNGRSPHLKYYPQPKTKDDVEGRETHSWGYQEKHSKEG